jgi:thymidylate synthase (FAD)
MKTADIQVYLIAKTQANPGVIQAWVDSLGAKDYEVPEDITDSESTIMHAAKRCYMAFEPGMNPNVTRVRTNWDDYFENILKSGHGSVLEHATYSFAIEGVSRVFTAELNRHRAGVAISEGSMRYIRFEDIRFWMPNIFNLTGLTPDSEEYQRRLASQELFKRAFTQDEENYKELCRIWNIEKETSFSRKKILTSAFRRIVGMGVSSGGVWTFNLRALRHILALRTSEHAEEEIAYTFSMIGKIVVESEPRIFCDFESTPYGWVPKYPKV